MLKYILNSTTLLSKALYQFHSIHLIFLCKENDLTCTKKEGRLGFVDFTPFSHKNKGLLTLFLQGLELFGSPCICAFSIELFGWGGGIICQKSLKIVIN